MFGRALTHKGNEICCTNSVMIPRFGFQNGLPIWSFQLRRHPFSRTIDLIYNICPQPQFPLIVSLQRWNIDKEKELGESKNDNNHEQTHGQTIGRGFGKLLNNSVAKV